MLDRARDAVPDVAWEVADLAQWTPAAPVDLLASNAALHWLDDHQSLFPRLLSHLNAGGILAVQMPAQHNAPSHQIGYALAESGRWRDQLKGLVRRRPILDPAEYHAILSPHASALDLWLTELVRGEGRRRKRSRCHCLVGGVRLRNVVAAYGAFVPITL